MNMMTSHQLRKLFLDFFASKDHKIVPSSSLVPQEDPTLLFTSAGMNQFKENFLGIKKDLKRAASCQKCLRTPDLERVGKTPAHHTFFEMLGNFSFGDYFKEEAIEWAWEFMIEVLGIPREKLAVSVYRQDEEAYKIWSKKIGLASAKISRFGEEDNFWPANAPKEGPNGPCGPCSEIFYDAGKGELIEIWNLVFTQFDRKEGGKLEPLPRKNIDTGMGLERLASVLQGVGSNFETDLFVPIMLEIEKILSQETQRRRFSADQTPLVRAIADHIRAVTFLIGDGVLPSNEARGYVERMLIRRGSRLGRNLGVEEPFLFRLVPTVARVMREPYPDLSSRESLMQDLVRTEEERFARTLDEGLQILEQETARLTGAKDKFFPGDVAFRLYDTFGLPIELTKEYVEAKGLKVDRKHFEVRLDEQRKISRSASQMGGEVFVETFAQKIRSLNLSSQFLGYEKETAEAQVLAVVEDRVVLDQTPFYGEAGGQIGDTGFLRNETSEYRVYDTKRVDEVMVHLVTPQKGKMSVGDKVTASIDAARRKAIMRNHTATHLLQAALRQVVGTHVEQSGSLVAEDRLRFDFTHVGKISKGDLEKVEAMVNQEILKNTPVQIHYLPHDEAKKRGAIAFFGEKYGETVRIIEVPNFSQEFCGGTHCRATGDIGLFRIIAEGAIGSGVRRIEAVTGEKAYERARSNEETLQQMAALLKTTPENVLQALEKTILRMEELEKQKEKWSSRSMGELVESWIEEAMKIGPIQVVSRTVEESDPSMLRSLWDRIKSRMKSGIACLGSVKEERVSLLVGITPDLANGNWDARKLITPLAEIVGGKGGGRKDLAQAGGKKVDQLARAIGLLPQLIKKQ